MMKKDDALCGPTDDDYGDCEKDNGGAEGIYDDDYHEIMMMMKIMRKRRIMWEGSFPFSGRESDNCAIPGSVSHKLSSNFSKKTPR